jgi:hypothetical protein
MEDSLGVKVLQPSKDLRRKRLGNILVKAAVLEEAATNGSTRHIFQET